MLLQWIFPFEGQCPCHTWNESLPFMLHKNNINIHEHLRFNHVMSLVYKIPTPYYLWVLLSQTKLFCFYVSVDLLDFSECLWPRWAVEALCRSTWCWEQLLKWVSYFHWGCWCCWNWCSAELVQFFRALQCTRLKGQTESAVLQDWELQRNFQSYIGFIKLIKITPSPKWATALRTLCCGSWNSECDSLAQWQWEATDRKQLPPCSQRGMCSEQSAVSVPEVLQLLVYPAQRCLCLTHRFK